MRKVRSAQPVTEIERQHLGFTMETKRKVEVFSAGCALCDEATALVKRVACPSCDVAVLDMNDATVAARAKSLGVASVPAVVIDGKPGDSCAGRGPTEDAFEIGVGVETSQVILCVAS